MKIMMVTFDNNDTVKYEYNRLSFVEFKNYGLKIVLKDDTELIYPWHMINKILNIPNKAKS